jgi:transposase InsO family protein
MEVHARAPLSPIGRRRVVDRVVAEGWSVAAAAEAAGVSERSVYRWLARWRAQGAAGLVDRRSVPGRIPHKTPAERVNAICALRRLRLTGAEIAECLKMPLSTVSAVLLREGLGKRSRLSPVEAPNRYERRAPGELIHIDIKKLGRIVVPGHAITGNRRQRAKSTRVGSPTGRSVGTAGWEFVHVAVDDFSRLAYAEVLADQRAATAVGFLRRALGYFARHGITDVQRVMTDNGSAYRAHQHRLACYQLGLKHLFTRPYRPRTNGKAERFIKTLTERWAHGRLYANSAERTAALDAWLDHYNFTRPHGSLSHKPPGSRLTRAPGNYS